MHLFENKYFIGYSGDKLSFKINCDALLDDDIETLAVIISGKIKFGKIFGIPRGGLRLAESLEKYLSITGPLLIVDDVLTTGKSMEAAKKTLGDNNAIGVVIFARNKCPGWIKPIFELGDWRN